MKSLVSIVTAAALAYGFPLSRCLSASADEGELPPPLPTPALPSQVVVGVYLDPPFNIRKPDGTWTGISVELWQEIARDLGIKYEFREVSLVNRFKGLAQGWLDVSVGPLTITPQREEVCDFTHAYYWTNLAIAVPSTSNPLQNSPLGLAYLGFLWMVFKVGLGLLAVMAVVAVLLWYIERRTKEAEFGGGNPLRGIGLALWWSAVTMAGVGYGDVIPRTALGRALAVVWMFTSLILISTFTATMASTLTAESFSREKGIQRIGDLRNLRIGAVSSSSGATFLETYHLAFQSIPYGKMFDVLEAKEVQAIVYDEPVLRYLVESEHPRKYTVLPLQLDRVLYGFALREGSTFREPLNRLILQKIHQPAWQALIARYLSP